MSTPTLAQELFQQLQGAPLQQISQQLGTDPTRTAGAVSAALPLLLGALGRNTARPQGAQALFGVLERDHTGLDLGSVLGAVLGGATGGRQTDGAAILGHVFGADQPRAEAGLGQATGLGGDLAGQLLKILAPIVLAFLAKRFLGQGQTSDPGVLGEVLGRERQSAGQQGGLIGAVLDQDGDGQVGLDDLMRIGGGLLGGKR